MSKIETEIVAIQEALNHLVLTGDEWLRFLPDNAAVLSYIRGKCGKMLQMLQEKEPENQNGGDS